jgi:cyclophilin family peptidyl-prolyl cis-trans isomerase/HEAT repeat protein
MTVIRSAGPVAPRRRTCGVLGSAALVLAVSGCATASVTSKKPTLVPFEQKMVWMLQLEDQRILKLPEPPAPTPDPAQKGRRPDPPPPPAASRPDLTVLAADAEPRVRRRAAVAIGRVRLPAGVPALLPLLSDPDAEVRQAAAFALGLIGDRSASEALVTLLADPEPLVRGRAAEALGLMTAGDAAPAIGKMVGEYARSAPVAAMSPDDDRWPAAPEAEAFKLGAFALVRLKAYDPLAAAVLGEGGRPIATWWPVAYALQRIGDPRAAPALRQLLQVKGRYTPAFAARGLGNAKDQEAASLLLPLIEPTSQPRELVASAIRALGQLDEPKAGARLAALAADSRLDATLRLEAVQALAALEAVDQLPYVQDLMTDPWPAMRAAALRAAVTIAPDSFILILSGLERDRHWLGRAALAEVLGTLSPEIAGERLKGMLDDEDQRVVPAVLRALVKLEAPDAATILLAQLKAPDYVVRETAASLLGQLKPAGGLPALVEAYEAGQADAAYGARAAAIQAIAAYGGPDAAAAVRPALADKDWAVRVKAAELLATLDPSADHQIAIRPAPGTPPGPYDDPLLAGPPYSPHAFIETGRGTIEIELAVLDAPQTARSFQALARKGFFNGIPVHRVVANFVVQAGDPRGDGEGGPGYTIRDELNERPHVRGTVGMALSWPDTGGSQFYITHSPQPHLDGRYTVFGHVVNGMDVVDRIQVGDVIERVRVWDGKDWD